MSNITLPSGTTIIGIDPETGNGIPVDGRQSVQYYKDIVNLAAPYIYCQVIVRKDDPGDLEHPKGIYVITLLDELGSVVSSGIKTLKEFQNITKQDVSLGNVDNTSDLDKPISTAVQNALNNKQDTINNLEQITSGAQAGTSALQPISGATPNNFVAFDSHGNIKDSTSKASDFATYAQGIKADSAIQGVKVNGTDLTPEDNIVDVIVPQVSVNSTTTGNPGTLAEVNDIGTGNNVVLDFVIPEGIPGHNPNLGTFLSTDTFPVTGQDGDYIIVITDDGQGNVTRKTWIYDASATGVHAPWKDTDCDANDGYFHSRQLLGDVDIVNDLTTGEEDDVLSAAQGKKILIGKGVYSGYLSPSTGTITSSSSWLTSEFIPFLTDLRFYDIYVGSTIGLCFYDKFRKYVGKYTQLSDGDQDVVLLKTNYQDISYVRFSTRTTRNGYCTLASLDGLLLFDNEVQNIITSVYGDFFNIEKSLLKNDGDYAVSSDKFGTDFIPIDATKPLTIYAYSGGTTFPLYVPICFYDKNYSCIGYKSLSGNTGNTLVEVSTTDIPSGTAFIRCSSQGRVGFIIANTLSAFISDVYTRINDKSIRYTDDLSDKLIYGCSVYYNTNNGTYALNYGAGNPSYANYKRTQPIPVSVGDVMKANPYQGSAYYVNVITDAELNVLRTFTFTSEIHEFTAEDLAGGGVYAIVSFVSSVSNPYVNLESTFDVASFIDKTNTAIKDRPRIPNNAFRSFAPKQIREKIMAMDDDVNILLLGDSMTALTNVAGDTLPNAANLPAGCNRDAITYQLWNRLCKNKPQCDRFDSTINIFTETGTWVLSDLEKFKKNADGTTTEHGMGEYSEDNCITHETSETNDSVAFSWDISRYEKLNFIHRLSAYDGTTQVTISCTSGKVEVYDRTNSAWVEANGYTFSQKLSATDSDTAHNTYTACWIRNYPLRMRRKSGSTGTVTLTFTNTGTGTFYYWGTERYNWNIVRITNIARAGRNIELLWRNIGREVILRDVDFIIFQLPLWNEFKDGGDVLSTTNTKLSGIVNDLADYSTVDNVKFARFQLVLNLYHTQSFSWDDNKNIQFYANGDTTKTPTNLPDYQLETKIKKYIEEYVVTENYSDKVVVANLIDVLYNIALSNGVTMEEFLSQYNFDFNEKPFTTDGVHLSNVGHGYYSELISPMLD